MNSLKNNKLAKNLFSLGIVQIANYILPLISVPIISRIIGPDKMGIIDYAAAAVTYFTLLIGYGFDYTATRKIAADSENVELRSQVFNTVFTTQILLFLISVLLFSILVVYLPLLSADRKVAYFSFFVCIAALFTQNWLFQALQDLSIVAVMNLCGKLVFTVFLLYFLKQKDQYYYQPLILGSTQILIGLFSFLLAKKKYHIKIKLVSVKAVFNCLQEGKIVFISLLVISLYTITDTIILGLFCTTTKVSYFTSAQRLIMVATSVISLPFAQAFFPYLANKFKQSVADAFLFINKLIPVISFLTLFIGVVMFFLGPFVIRIFYGLAFSPAIIVFRILCFSPFILILSNIYGVQIMLNLKMDKLFFKIMGSGALLSVLMAFPLIYYFAYVGAALDWLLSECFITLTLWITLKKKGFPLKCNFSGLYSLRNLFELYKKLKNE